MPPIVIVAIVIVVLLLGVDLVVFRGLHGAKRNVDEAWTALEQVLARRSDDQTDSEVLEAQQRFNDAVDVYNSRIESPPWSAIARAFKFTARERFDSSAHTDENGAQP